MGSNSFGNLFKITTWGESHGKAVGVVIDGCPAGLALCEQDINEDLKKRAPGKNIFTSPRKEEDLCEILSGVFEGLTTGAPISIIIYNKDVDSSKYAPIKDILRPGHANFTYLEKYGSFDFRGGGRASARETACRVAAGSVAKKLLKEHQIEVFAFLTQVGDVKTKIDNCDSLRERVDNDPIFCPDRESSLKMQGYLKTILEEGDSIGGVVEFIALNVPVGLGDPVYEKLEANLAKAMMSIPASKGFEIGSGFESVLMKGSLHNDAFLLENDQVKTSTNYAGGILGGISNGMPLIGRVALKPASSIKKESFTLNDKKQRVLFKLPEGSRHDPCVAIRAVPVVEAMLAIVLADALLINKTVEIEKLKMGVL